LQNPRPRLGSRAEKNLIESTAIYLKPWLAAGHSPLDGTRPTHDCALRTKKPRILDLLPYIQNVKQWQHAAHERFSDVRSWKVMLLGDDN
jgi:hypothetical protein